MSDEKKKDNELHEKCLKMSELAEKLAVVTEKYCRVAGYSPPMAAIALFAAALHIVDEEIMESEYMKERKPEADFDEVVNSYIQEADIVHAEYMFEKIDPENPCSTCKSRAKCEESGSKDKLH
jgi:hypothetical protein